MNRTAKWLLAACLVSVIPAAYAGGDPAAGKSKSAVCQSCHGPDGNSPSPQFPRLAGQHPDYLVRALNDYRSGQRKNPVMAPFAASLSPQDIEDLASFYARQKGVFVK